VNLLHPYLLALTSFYSISLSLIGLPPLIGNECFLVSIRSVYYNEHQPDIVSISLFSLDFILTTSSKIIYKSLISSTKLKGSSIFKIILFNS